MRVLFLRITPIVPVKEVCFKGYGAPGGEHHMAYPYLFRPTVEKFHPGMAIWSPHPL